MPDQRIEEEIQEAKALVRDLRKVWTRKTDRPMDDPKVNKAVNTIVEKMIYYEYPKWAKDVQNLCSAAHYNVLISPEDEQSEYWMGVIKGMRYVDEIPPNSPHVVGKHQNPFQFLNWSGQQSAFRWRIKLFKRHIMQRCDKCGHICPYYYPRIGSNNSPDYLESEDGFKVKTHEYTYVATNPRYLMLRATWKKAEVKNICPRCWDNGRGELIPCPTTWMHEVYSKSQDDDDSGYDLIANLSVEPDIEEQMIFTNIVDRFIADRWVKLGSREHELLTVLFKCPDTEISNYYTPLDNDPPVPATKLLEDPVWGAVAAVCMFCEEPCKNGIIGHGKCKNYQLKLANYYGTTQTCVNQYRKRLIGKLQHFCSVHKVTFTLPE